MTKTKIQTKNAHIRLDGNSIIFTLITVARLGHGFLVWFVLVLNGQVHTAWIQQRRRQQMLAAVKRIASTSSSVPTQKYLHPLLERFSTSTKCHNWQTDSNLYNEIVQILPPTLVAFFLFFSLASFVCRLHLAVVSFSAIPFWLAFNGENH